MRAEQAFEQFFVFSIDAPQLMAEMAIFVEVRRCSTWQGFKHSSCKFFLRSLRCFMVSVHGGVKQLKLLPHNNFG